MDIQQEISKKGFDVDKVVSYAIKNPQCIGQLIEGITAPKGSIRFSYEKVLRFISEERPDLIYPYFDIFKKLSVCDNSFLKWGALLIIGNLAVADEAGKIDQMFDEYYAPVKGPVMVTASNIIGSSIKIVRAKPYLTGKITKEILKVEKAKYEHHGELSPECKNVAIGQAIDTFDQLFDQLEDKEVIVKFVKKQLKNSRAKVVKKAENFLKKHAS